MTLINITCKDKAEARKISLHLLKKKLIACSNFFPIRSMYMWQGKLQNEPEYAILAKTKKGKYEKIKEEVSKVHSYKVPCILKIDSEANLPYQKWVDEEVR